MRVFLCFVIAAVLVAVQSASITMKQELKNRQKCRNETGVSEEALSNSQKTEEINDPKVKDYALCTMKKAGFINDNGEFQIDALEQHYKEGIPAGHFDKIEKMVTECAVKQDSPQESAVHFTKCVYESRKKQQIPSFEDECKSESGLSTESLLRNNYTDEVKKQKAKNYHFCILKNYGFMNNNGEFQLDKIREVHETIFSDEYSGEVEEIITKCAVKKSTPQDSAIHFETCSKEIIAKNHHAHRH